MNFYDHKYNLTLGILVVFGVCPRTQERLRQGFPYSPTNRAAKNTG